MQKKFLTIFVLICIAVSFLPLSIVESAPWIPGGETGPYLTCFLARAVTGGGEALLTADVRPDILGEEVFHAGGPVQPNSTAGSVTCLNGITGNQIWESFIYGIGDTATMQMADVDRDRNFEIIVTLQAPSAGQWYLLQAYYVHASSGPSIVLSVNGAVVASLNQDTSGANNVASIRFGIGYYDAGSATVAYIDDVTVER